MSYTVAAAAEELGITPGGVYHRLRTGALKGRKTNKGWVVYLNGNEPAAEQPMIQDDELLGIADDLIQLGRKLKRAIKEHDAEVRRETIVDFATTIAETAKRR